MAEKGDVSVDTVSLPPTYAPSEAYTDSPPPAYRRAKSTTVQVARMVCITLLAAAFMIGFFTITSNYLSAKQCNCHHSGHQNGELHAASFLPQVEKLIGNEDLNKVQEMNGNGIDGFEEPGLPKVLLQPEVDEVAVPDAQEELDDNIPEEEVEALVEEAAELEEIERELEEEQVGIQDIMKQQFDDMKKKIKLPIDLILGNPALAGRDVNCEVERRQQPIGGGIVTQAIIVTCSDNDDKEKVEGPGIVMTPPGPRRLGPPLSLLAPIMKMLSSRARSRVDRPIQIKTMVAPKPFSLNAGPQPCSPNGPFPCFMNQPKSLGPIPGRMNGPMPGPINGPIPGPFNGPMRNPFNGPFPGPMNAPFSGPMNAPFSGPMNAPFSGPMNAPFSGPMNAPFSGPMNDPFSGPMPGPNHGPISRHIHIPINEPKPNALPSPFRGSMPFLSNGPILSGPKPIFENKEDNEPRNRMLPFALRPLIRVSPRMPRILALATNPDRHGPQTSISSLQRGANNIASREPKIMSVNPPPLPEAQGRALPSPVTLPGLRILPARLLSAPAFMRGMRRDDPRPMTHMEMRGPEPENRVPDFEPRFPDFGPPRVHTVIGPNQPSVNIKLPPNMLPMMNEPSFPQIVSKSIAINSRPIPMEIMSPPKPIALIHKTRPIAGPQIPIFPPPPPPPPPSVRLPPPPPKMDPEGRSGIITNINPDAEMIVHSQPPQLITKEVHEQQQQDEDRKHHLLVMN